MALTVPEVMNKAAGLPNVEVIEMLISNRLDYVSGGVAMVSAKQWRALAEDILAWRDTTLR